MHIYLYHLSFIIDVNYKIITVLNNRQLLNYVTIVKTKHLF